MENRIAARREKLGLSQRELARRMSSSGQMVGMLERGERKLDVDWLRRLAAALECQPVDLLPENMAGSMSEAELVAGAFNPSLKQTSASNLLNPSTPTTTSRIPEVDVRGGMGGGGVVALEVNHVDEWGNSMAADNVRATWELPNDYLRHELRVAPAKAYLIEVRGDSMSPTLETGDRVMIDTADTVPAPGGVFALFDGLGVVVKRLEHVPMSDPPIIKIISDNPHHGVYERTLEEIRIIGRAIWFGRRM